MITSDLGDPRSIPNMTSWYLRNNYDGVTATWADYAGISANWIAIPASQPTSVNGVPTFDGVSDFLAGEVLGSLFGASAKTIFGVFKSDVSTTDAPPSVFHTNTGIFSVAAEWFGVHHRGGSNKVQVGNFTLSAGNATEHPYTAGTKALIEATHDGISIVSRLNGGAPQTAASGATGDMTTHVELGRSPVAPSPLYLTGAVYEVMTWNRVLNTTELAFVRQFLRNIHGV